MTYRIYSQFLCMIGLQFHVIIDKIFFAKGIDFSSKSTSIFSKKGTFVFIFFFVLFISLYSFQYAAATDIDTRTNCDNCLAPTMRGLGFLQIDDGLTIDGKVFKIISKSNPISTTTVETGTNLQIKLKMYEDMGASNVQNVQLYMNLLGTASLVESSDTYIMYEKGKSVNVIDPDGIFSDVKQTTLLNGNYLVLTYNITFAKPMKKSDIIIKAWDFERNPEVNKVLDALEVVAAGTLPTPPPPQVEPMKEKEIASPVAQLKSGVEPQNVECKVGLQKAMKPGSEIPVCVKPATLKILLQRGWR